MNGLADWIALLVIAGSTIFTALTGHHFGSHSAAGIALYAMAVVMTAAAVLPFAYNKTGEYNFLFWLDVPLSLVMLLLVGLYWLIKLL